MKSFKEWIDLTSESLPFFQRVVKKTIDIVFRVFHSLSEVLQIISMADSLAQLTARAEAAENAVDGLAR